MWLSPVSRVCPVRSISYKYAYSTSPPLSMYACHALLLESVSSFGGFICPNTNTLLRAPEFGPAIVANDDFAWEITYVIVSKIYIIPWRQPTYLGANQVCQSIFLRHASRRLILEKTQWSDGHAETHAANFHAFEPKNSKGVTSNSYYAPMRVQHTLLHRYR